MIREYQPSSYTIHNARHSMVHYNMMRAGLGALLSVDLLISATDAASDAFFYFVPKSPFSYRTLYLKCAKKVEQNPIAKRFLEIAKEVCASDEWRHKELL